MEMIIENILKQLAHRKYSIISSHFYYKVKLENISIDFFSKQQMLQELREKSVWVRVFRKFSWTKEKFNPDFKIDFDEASRGIPSAKMN